MTQLSDHFHTKNEFDTFIIQRVTILFANPFFGDGLILWKIIFSFFNYKPSIFFSCMVAENICPPNEAWFLQISGVMTE